MNRENATIPLIRTTICSSNLSLINSRRPNSSFIRISMNFLSPLAQFKSGRELYSSSKEIAEFLSVRPGEYALPWAYKRRKRSKFIVRATFEIRSANANTMTNNLMNLHLLRTECSPRSNRAPTGHLTTKFVDRCLSLCAPTYSRLGPILVYIQVLFYCITINIIQKREILHLSGTDHF